jgi:hypothetical protein
VLYLVAWEGCGDDENTWEPCEHISNDLIRDYYERQILESEAADAEGKPEDDDGDDEFMEVESTRRRSSRLYLWRLSGTRSSAG